MTSNGHSFDVDVVADTTVELIEILRKVDVREAMLALITTVDEATGQANFDLEDFFTGVRAARKLRAQ